ncbi:hypothetical protein FHR83_009177 [Actinoplanes campanulatus]|uniref:Uncharacterized protein n=2 Tax=Actinoplanes campanulatus TaxID=113559 RepID=A0A7W5AS62_9ACTN|nr:hypothetical protein [Actinoplanes campanulatus]
MAVGAGVHREQVGGDAEPMAGDQRMFDAGEVSAVQVG